MALIPELRRSLKADIYIFYICTEEENPILQLITSQKKPYHNPNAVANAHLQPPVVSSSSESPATAVDTSGYLEKDW